MIGQVRNLNLKFKGKGFTNFVSLTSLPTMELLALMYMLITSHTLISKQKMVRGFTSFYSLIIPLPIYFLPSSFEEWSLDLLLIFAEHFAPLLKQIAKLEEAIYNIRFEQHWLEAQTDRKAIGTVWGTRFLFYVKIWMYDVSAQ